MRVPRCLCGVVVLLDRHFDFVRTATRASMAGSPTSRLEHVERDLDGAGQDLETVIEQLAGDGQRREDLQHGVVAAHAFNDETIGERVVADNFCKPAVGIDPPEVDAPKSCLGRERLCVRRGSGSRMAGVRGRRPRSSPWQLAAPRRRTPAEPVAATNASWFPRNVPVCSAGTSRAVNHSCDPNCFTTPCGLEIAVRDIEARDELTNDCAELGGA